MDAGWNGAVPQWPVLDMRDVPDPFPTRVSLWDQSISAPSSQIKKLSPKGLANDRLSHWTFDLENGPRNNQWCSFIFDLEKLRSPKGDVTCPVSSQDIFYYWAQWIVWIKFRLKHSEASAAHSLTARGVKMRFEVLSLQEFSFLPHGLWKGLGEDITRNKTQNYVRKHKEKLSRKISSRLHQTNLQISPCSLGTKASLGLSSLISSQGQRWYLPNRRWSTNVCKVDEWVSVRMDGKADGWMIDR